MSHIRKIFSRLLRNTGRAQAHTDEVFQSAVALHEQGNLDEAAMLYRRVIAADGRHAGAHYLLGVIAFSNNATTDAVDLIRQAIDLAPEKPDYLRGCGEVYQAMGDHQRAAGYYQRAVELKPDFTEAWFNLANARRKNGDTEQAINCYMTALRLRPDLYQAYYELAGIHSGLQDWEAAARDYTKVLDLQPRHAEACNNLGVIRVNEGRLNEALGLFERAVELNPDYAVAHNNLANVCKDLAQYETATEHYLRALAIEPGYAEANSNYLLCLNYIPGTDPGRLLAAHRDWATHHSRHVLTAPHTGSRGRGGRLRIGYVSPDFHEHSVARFIEPVLQNHDRDRFEITCFYNSMIEDEVTARLITSADNWENITHLDDESAADLVRSRGIDILVDLSGHTSGNRLPLFARRPAPVQVTYLGYPATTGLDCIDYRITDNIADPPGLTDAYYSENLVRLSGCFLCYQPPPAGLAPAPAKRPGPRSGVTFTSFNNYAKVSQPLAGLWAEILNSVPGSRLLVKSHQLRDRQVRGDVSKRFKQLGITSEQLELHGWIDSFEQHMQLYNSTDIALDTYPYNGTTTTCEALWMGIPVVTQAGAVHCSRVGASILTAAGLPGLVANSAGEYVSIAVRLATDGGLLEQARADTGAGFRSSALTDARGFTARLEKFFRQAAKRQ